jgi:hypothetical protein
VSGKLQLSAVAKSLPSVVTSNKVLSCFHTLSFYQYTIKDATTRADFSFTAVIDYPSGSHSVLRGSQEIRDQFPRGSVAKFL